MPVDLDQSLKRLERTEYYQRLLTAILVLLLSAFIVFMFFFSDIRNLYQAEMSQHTFDVLIMGLLLLSFLFVSYLAVKDNRIRQLRRTLIQEKTASAVLESEREKLEVLLQIGGLLNSNVEQQKVFDTICSGIVKCLKGDESSLMLHDPNHGILKCVSAYGAKRELLLGQTVNWGESVAGWMAKHRVPLLLQKDLEQDKFNNFVKKERNITSAICLPLELGGDVKGILNVNLIDRPDRQFDQHDLRIAKIFAQNAVLAIERALYTKATEKQEVVTAAPA